ncbi:hypothetical protein DLAC_04258 [Tieghemostelium lacteum]|uniref:Uncharacterized protein n=1 Tax=Tieghemostelium lacteum TaxID=361077 RepID=A0A151ZSQ1_TIELA|nr:hypothetical protein DLAC_04258 [Tieghemostelium lacteum]|eukprot:KYQ96938.1 hypothetical protein DLAC_04258 [Tieghemostelium lacteum]
MLDKLVTISKQIASIAIKDAQGSIHLGKNFKDVIKGFKTKQDVAMAIKALEVNNIPLSNIAAGAIIKKYGQCKAPIDALDFFDHYIKDASPKQSQTQVYKQIIAVCGKMAKQSTQYADKALQIFTTIPYGNRNTAMFNTMIGVFKNAATHKPQYPKGLEHSQSSRYAYEALKTVHLKMSYEKPNTKTYNVLILTLGNAAKYSISYSYEALDNFYRMPGRIKKNNETYQAVMLACQNAAIHNDDYVEQAINIFFTQSEYFINNKKAYDTLISMCENAAETNKRYADRLSEIRKRKAQLLEKK